MRILIFIISILAVQLSFAEPADKTCDHDAKNFRCVKYIKNYDADTITFDIHDMPPIIGEKMPIRVRGVDTPEIKTKDQCEKTKGRTARRLVENLLKHAKRIDLQNVERGKYFRIVADVIIDGKNLSDYLLKNNLAYTYNGGAKKKINWCDVKVTEQKK